MLKFTQGPPDEMQVLIACGIAAYLIAFPIIMFLVAVCAEVMRRTQLDEPGAARVHSLVPGHPRVSIAPPREAELASAV